MPKEPASWKEVQQLPPARASKWRKAAQEEFEALQHNKARHFKCSGDPLQKDQRAHPKRDWTGIKWMAKYLKETAELKLKLPATDSPELVGYTDADWAENATDRESTSGNVFFFGEGV